MGQDFLYKTISNQIRNWIQQGRFGVSEKLPTTTEFAEEFNTSPMTVNKALEILVAVAAHGQGKRDRMAAGRRIGHRKRESHRGVALRHGGQMDIDPEGVNFIGSRLFRIIHDCPPYHQPPIDEYSKVISGIETPDR